LKNIFKNKIGLLVVSLLLITAAGILDKYYSARTEPTIHEFEKTLHRKEKLLEEELNALSTKAQKQDYKSLFAENTAHYNQLFEQEGIALLIYENDTLKFWSNNSIAVENWIKEVCLDTRIVKLRNGWFEVLKPSNNRQSARSVIGLLLIKNDYPYLNQYLTNEFQASFKLSSETKLLTEKKTTSIAVKDYQGRYLFSVEFSKEQSLQSNGTLLALVLYLLGFSISFIFLYHFVLSIQLGQSKNVNVFILITIVFSFRYLSTVFLFPNCFYHFELFKPIVFADYSSIWQYSLGDLTINTLLLFVMVYMLSTKISFANFSSSVAPIKLVVASVLFLSYLVFAGFASSTIIVLIRDSNIAFDLKDFFSLNIYSFLSIGIVAVMLFVYFLLAHYLILFINQIGIAKSIVNTGYYTTLCASVIIAWVSNFDLFCFLFPFLLLFLLHIFQKGQKKYSFVSIVFMVFLFSLFSVQIVIRYGTEKELANRKLFAEKLATEKDPIAEMLFSDIEKKIISDTLLSSFVCYNPKQWSEFEKRIKQNYFGGYWEKYTVKLALFDSLCFSVSPTGNSSFDNIAYFDELINNSGKQTKSKNLFYLQSTSSKISYLAKLPFLKNKTRNIRFGTLYIELDAKFIADEIGFPELLLDRNIGLTKELSSYAYAKYKNNKLITQFGKFPYTTSNQFELPSTGNYKVVYQNDFSHLLYPSNEQTLVVLSKKDEGVLGIVTTFSYLFAFYSLVLLLILFTQQVISTRLLQNFSFKYKIQVVLVSMILLSLVLFVGATIYYIQQQFELKNKQNINEKIQSIVMDLESKFTETGMSKGYSDYATYVLKKLANVFFTDINLYDLNGSLYASSRPQVFEEGLTSKKINPEAFLNIGIKGQTSFLHDESIGKLKYLSAYIPFRNKEGEVLAYLNLPYFAKQSELRREISDFLVAVINIYVLLFALAIISAILISNYVTRPLKIIQDNLRKLKLGKANEHIHWKENDEIGSLVSEYNRMIDALAQSAERLAKSERESAWREMAKQVAHEIKNPLTPMKLSVQHLQRTWRNQDADMDTKMERLTKTIIEQIDTLSTIANEFSNFAQLPRSNSEAVNVNEVLINCVSLFSDAHPCNFHVLFNKEKKNLVFADKDQLIRIFNNLIKNALQAIPDHKQGQIKIDIQQENAACIISIADNGSGIDPDFKSKIFTPNFTTKSAGMGLGLALVKSSVESMNGQIWFESETNSGTTFYIRLPLY
jgi:two-component system, NtrC family, nitrogen regulation sensor histidine kinase NtrY